MDHQRRGPSGPTVDLAYGYVDEAGCNNGSLRTLVDSVRGTTGRFACDRRDQLRDAQRDGEGGWSQRFVSDAWGIITISGSGSPKAYACAPQTNRIVSSNVAYDPAGNVISQGEVFLPLQKNQPVGGNRVRLVTAFRS